MINISIDNQEVEEFLKDEYRNDPKSLVTNFVDYLKQQKIKNDVKVSIDEIEKGEYLDIDSAFDEVTSKYAD